MKLKRTSLTLALAFCMMLCLCVGASAAEPAYTDAATVTITKVYQLKGAGGSPAETFTLAQQGEGRVTDGEAESAPALGTITGAAFAADAATEDGAEAEITVELPVYDRVGVYEYTLREVAGTTAGVSYYGSDIRLVVTVINGEESGKLRIASVHTESEGNEKSDRFPNSYSAGSLSIHKTVTGNLGDKTKYFRFTLKLEGEQGKTYAEAYTLSGGSHGENPASVKLGEEVTLYLKHDETITVANLPYGVSYTVEEDTPEDYELSCDGESGSIHAPSQTASFVNNKGGTPDTGISLDTLPYVLTLSFVVILGVTLGLRKRFVKR